MLNLFEMLQKSQGGQAAEAMARQFGLSPGQAQSAIDALLPAFGLAMQNIMRDPRSWPGLMTMAAGAANPFVPAGLQPDAVRAFFGSGGLAEQVASQAAAASGVNSQVLQAMMPVMASSLAPGFLTEIMQRNMGAWFGQPAPAPGPFPGIPANWGELMGQFMQAGVPQPPPSPAQHAAEKPEAPNPFDPAGFARIMQQMMGQAPAEPDAPPPPPPPTSSELGMDAMTRLVETGREAQQQHLEALRALFSQMWPEKPAS